MKTDQEQLDASSEKYYYSPKMSIDNRLRKYLIERCLPYSRGPRVLELGFMDGQWTDRFLARSYTVDIVEGARKQYERAVEIYRGNQSVRAFHSLFEDFIPDTKYDTILAGGMIKHLPDPAKFLVSLRNWLQDDGVLLATTPNGASLHRRVGAYMDLLPTPESLTPADLEVSNLRVYNRYTFRHELQQGGWKVMHLKGAAFKPVSTEMMAEWSDELLNALDQVAEELQDYAWYIYAICRK